MNPETKNEFLLDESIMFSQFIEGPLEIENSTVTAIKPEMFAKSEKAQTLLPKTQLMRLTSRDSTQMNLFVNKFIKPEIQESPITKQKSDRRISRKEINFNLLIVGEKGMGQNSFLRTFICHNINKKENLETVPEGKENMIGEGLYEKSYHLIKENQKICLNVINIPEYGCGMRSDATFSNIMSYIDETFKNYFKLECSLDRSSREDRHIHCCLYFISPYGHGLKPLDIAFMKLFQNKINIVPIVAKSDSFTKSELQRFKEGILADLEFHKIHLFEFSNNSDNVNDELEDILSLCDELKEKIPLAIISSNETICNNKKKEERVRQYPWGSVNADDPENSSFIFLENILLKSHTNYFKTVTRSIHYENFRVRYILDHVNQNNMNEI